MTNTATTPKPTAPVKDVNARPDVDVYDPDDHSITKVPFDLAKELSDGGYKTGGDAATAQLNDSALAKTASTLEGVAHSGTLGLWGLARAALGRAGVKGAEQQERTAQQVVAQHPYYNMAGQAAPIVGTLPFGGGAYGIGSLGLRGAAEAGGYSALAKIVAGTADAAVAGMPAMLADSVTSTAENALAGHKAWNAQKERYEQIKDPVTVELLASNAWDTFLETGKWNLLFHGGVLGAHAAGKIAKGTLGALEKAGVMERELVKAPKDYAAEPRMSAYRTVEKSAVEPSELGLSPREQVAAKEAEEAAKKAAAAEERAPSANEMVSDDSEVADLPSDIRRGFASEAEAATPVIPRGNDRTRPAHLEAMVRDHDVIALSGEMPKVVEEAEGIPRAEAVIPKAVKPVESPIEYAGNSKLQRQFERAQMKLSDAEAHAAEDITLPEIPKTETPKAPKPPEPPAPVEFDPTKHEPEFIYPENYSQKHRVEAIRQAYHDRLSKVDGALEKWDLNRKLTRKINYYDKNRHKLGAAEKYNKFLDKKKEVKAWLTEKVPRTYDPITKEYAPSYKDLDGEYMDARRGKVKSKPKVTFGAKTDKAAEAQHIENMKAYQADLEKFQAAERRAAKAHQKALDNVATTTATEKKRVADAVKRAQDAVGDVEQKIIDHRNDFKAGVERKYKAAVEKFERDTKKAVDDAADATRRAQQRIDDAYKAAQLRKQGKPGKKPKISPEEKKAIADAERHAKEIAALEKKQMDAIIAETSVTDEQKFEAEVELRRKRAAQNVKDAAEAEKIKTRAAREEEALAKKEAAFQKKAAKAQADAKPRWEETKTMESEDAAGLKTTTQRIKHGPNGPETHTTIKIKFPKQPPKMIAGKWKPVIKKSNIIIGGGTVGALFGPHAGGLFMAAASGLNAGVEHVLNNESLHRQFGKVVGGLERNILPTAKRLIQQNKVRGRRTLPSPQVSVSSYHKTSDTINYLSQNPEAIHQAVDEHLPNAGEAYPETVNGMKMTLSKGAQALGEQQPKKPFDPTMQEQQYNPPRAAQISFLRKVKLIGRPLEALQSGDPMAIRLVSEVYPALYKEYCAQLTHFVQHHPTPLYDRQARLISQFLGANVRPIDDPAALQRLQQSGGPEQPPQNQQKPIGKTSAPTKAATQRASLDAPDAALNALGG